MGIFKGFFAFRSVSVKYHKLSLFTGKFGGFLGEELGEGYPPNLNVSERILYLTALLFGAYALSYGLPTYHKGITATGDFIENKGLDC